MKMYSESTKCCICNDEIYVDNYQTDIGYDAWPIANGRCCNTCYISIVLPAFEDENLW